ncbi:hypothetical protein [Bosea sp. PAMC 26642]|uniref:hypothetical protein n=1 Tax=Bosea sp. (strain PAMC 26642) TaxID=1792307 RepID=UPI0007701C44|nr:hypothetical protein [Bosea sp. PAMC 26642]AMJ61822.1 hypothetical protein AXW83_17265 [Bosea sp. PAMC 26642]
MSTITLDSFGSQAPDSPASTGQHTRKVHVGLALESAGRLVLRQPKTVSFIVILLALVLGSLAGASLSGIGRMEPPPLVRLTTVEKRISPVRGEFLSAANTICRSAQQKSCGATASR